MSTSSYRRAWPWLLLIPMFILLLIPGAEKFEGANIFEAFWNWAWDRHHNALSWAVRSLMMLPFIYFSYQRNGHGIAVSLIAIATNFFWFPMPTELDPGVVEFLASEREWMMAGWDAGKVLLTLGGIVGLVALSYTFWQRSLWAGLLIVDAIFIVKAVGSLGIDQSGWSLIPFLVVAIIVFNIAILAAVRYLRTRREHRDTAISHPSVA